MAVLLGKRCNDQQLVLSGYQTILEHAVQLLCDAIERGENGASEKKRVLRNMHAAMLNKLPVTCGSLRSIARGDTRYTAVMFYERTRLGAAGSGHFLEGLAPGLSLFSGSTAVSLQDDDLKKLVLRDVVADRIKTVNNLEQLSNDSSRLQTLVRDYTLPDIATGLPGRVHVFVARMRAICQGLQRVKQEAAFGNCKNCECNRRFYKGMPTEHSPEVHTSGGPNLCPAPKSGSMDPVDVYWDQAAGEAELKHEQREFCTWSCCMQWRWQLEQAMPNMSADIMVADYQCRKDGRARVPEALRACGKRNEVASRHFRTIEKDHRAFPAISHKELKKQRLRRIRLLNVDLGILYASSMLAESKTMSSNKVLAGAAEGWRSRPLFYAKALKTVGRLYDKHHIGGNVVSNMLIHEPFLQKLKEKATTVF